MKHTAAWKSIGKWLILFLAVLISMGAQAEEADFVVGTGDTRISIQIVTSVYDFPTYCDVYTNESNLLDALLFVNLVQGEEGPWGFVVTTVNGRTADYERNDEYWQIIYTVKSKGSFLLGTGLEPLGTGIEHMPIENGDHFIFSLENSDNGFEEGIVEALAIDNLATRSGPSTAYRETGSYSVMGEYVSVISFAYDKGGVCWVQCEVVHGNKLRRVYTGLKRLDAATFDFNSIPEEVPLDYQAKVAATSKAMFGPGDGYGTYDSLTVDKGQTVTVIAIENEYAQVEWTTTKQSYRAWVPIHTLKY